MNQHITDDFRGYPQFMSLNKTEAKVVSYNEIAIGDELIDKTGVYQSTVKNILEKRKAKGEYNDDNRPNFYHIEIEKELNRLQTSTNNSK